MVLYEDLGSLAGRLEECHHEEVEVHREPVHDGHLGLALGSHDPPGEYRVQLMIHVSMAQMRSLQYLLFNVSGTFSTGICLT